MNYTEKLQGLNRELKEEVDRRSAEVPPPAQVPPARSAKATKAKVPPTREPRTERLVVRVTPSLYDVVIDEVHRRQKQRLAGRNVQGVLIEIIEAHFRRALAQRAAGE